MFHLTRYKYLFFAISGIVILPGLLALIFWGLNPGIDFTNGASIDLRFQASPNVVTTQGVTGVFKAAGAQDLRVLASTDESGGTPSSQYAFIKFSRPIGTDESSAVVKLLEDPTAKLPKVDEQDVHTLFTVALPDGKTTYGLMVVPFKGPVAAKDVQAALAKLPPTSAPPVTNTTTGATPAASPTATGATPGATSGATPAATAAASPTAAAKATPAATPTTTPAPTTFPVSVSDVQMGANQFTYTVETQTDFTQRNKAHGGASIDDIVAQLQSKYGYAYVQGSNEVGPAIASETTTRAVFAVLLASAAILLYIAIAFHKVGSFRQSARYGACAIIALLHDALVVLGLWAIFGKLFDFQVDTLFVTAVLTVIGFSVHDTIVVFDRIRENMARRTTETFDQVVNASLIQTMSRSLNTSLTVLFTLTALTLFGGASIREFTLALLIGIASGTYSSIFNASMLLVLWENGEWRSWPIIRNYVRPVEETTAYRRGLVRAGVR